MAGEMTAIPNPFNPFLMHFGLGRITVRPPVPIVSPAIRL